VVGALRKSAAFAALLCLWCLSLGAEGDAKAAESHIGSLIVEVHARATPPGISVGAIYFSIKNTGSTADRLLSVSTPAAARVEIHESRQSQGMMQMREVSSVDCPPGATVTAAPGGLHVMLLGLAAPLAAGSDLEVSLHFRDAGVLTLKAPVN
jgi:periplasmic copper chaperone A